MKLIKAPKLAIYPLTLVPEYNYFLKDSAYGVSKNLKKLNATNKIKREKGKHKYPLKRNFECPKKVPYSGEKVINREI